jgi:transcriptional regulator with XRE-family HTH domain
VSKIFSTRLKAARELRKMSQGDLATKSGLQPSAISHFETGNRSPSFENLKRLADALNVTTDYLLGREEQRTGPISNKLARYTENFTDEDFDMLEAMAETLARKSLVRRALAVKNRKQTTSE